MAFVVRSCGSTVGHTAEGRVAWEETATPCDLSFCVGWKCSWWWWMTVAYAVRGPYGEEWHGA